MEEYAINKQKIKQYREKSGRNRLLLWLCNVMEWINEHFIKNQI